VNASVAITAIISERAVELVAIVTGGWLIHSAIPQLRMSAPKTNGNGTQDGGKP
jgi:hypothetical protein